MGTRSSTGGKGGPVINGRSSVEQHYGRGRILDSILAALHESGLDLARLRPEDLAPIDEFHIRGRDATIELAQRGSLPPGTRVLDVGSGLGGSARYLAAKYSCHVTGIDLTQEYVDVARGLAGMVGLDGQVTFRHGNALEMPFDNDCFDVVWTEHVQMNVADKLAFYREICRVLRPGGALLFHDVFQGDGRPLYFPVPWADGPSLSHLVTPDEVREVLSELGFTIHDWVDTSEKSRQWFVATVERLKSTGIPPLGLHLLIGTTATTKFENIIRNLSEGRIVVYQARAQRAACVV